MILFRLVWSVETENRFEKHEYLGDKESTWRLWWAITNEIPAFHTLEALRVRVSEGRESMLALPDYQPPKMTAKVYALSGIELHPEQGIDGLIIGA